MTDQAPIVYVVDDDLSVRGALCSLIRSVGLRVEVFASAQEFLHHARHDAPACLVLDVRMPGLSGLDLQRELSKAGDAIPIIFITGHGDIAMSVGAMKAGAIEFLPKPFRDQDLLDAIAHAHARDATALHRRAELTAIRRRYDTLTEREREVIVLTVRGMLNKQIAAELGISEQTIKVHRHHIMQKMAAASLPALVRMVEKLNPTDLSGGAGPA
ncbi:response regulator transcription factor [Duganella sp. LX20W]|uniref:Response regulator transcription factor n=1 Tax=Rugamonas brunnea TaxID=2758569 RepID=A0A7W2EUQ8_9BURK|nr:response regulator transcription factor [Rugamonas brunnea]MBA5638920.1 response regulator transcription factor [Rugamonas brunnea]